MFSHVWPKTLVRKKTLLSGGRFNTGLRNSWAGRCKLFPQIRGWRLARAGAEERVIFWWLSKILSVGKSVHWAHCSQSPTRGDIWHFVLWNPNAMPSVLHEKWKQSTWEHTSRGFVVAYLPVLCVIMCDSLLQKEDFSSSWTIEVVSGADGVDTFLHYKISFEYIPYSKPCCGDRPL